MAGVHKICPICKAEAWDDSPLPCQHLKISNTVRTSSAVMIYRLAAEVNVMLAYLRSFDVAGLVDACFLEGFRNPAPGELLRMQVDRLQALLDEIYKTSDGGK